MPHALSAVGPDIAQEGRRRSILAAETRDQLAQGGERLALACAADGDRDMQGSISGARANGAIAPYWFLQRFTDGMERQVMAHHIFEQKWMLKLGIGDVATAPSVILTAERHAALHKKLVAAAAKFEDSMTMDRLWKIYEKVYAEHPEWLSAIKHYFGK